MSESVELCVGGELECTGPEAMVPQPAPNSQQWPA